MANGTEHFTASQQAGLSLSGVDMAYGLASSEASFQKGRIAQQEKSELESTILELERLAKKAEQSAKKKQRRSGIGRLVGAVIGTAIGAATGNPALARAAMTAAGGAIGGKIAQKGDVKSGLPSQFVPGGIFYANSREELEMKAQDFQEAISEINEGMDRQLGVNFIFDMITGASFAKAGQYVPEGANLSLDEMYQIGDISFKDYIKFSAKQLLPGGLSETDNAQLTGGDMAVFDADNPETWVTDYENPGQFKNAPKDFDITSYQNEKMIQSMQDFSRNEMFNSYGQLHDPATAEPIKPGENILAEVNVESVKPLDADIQALSKAFDGDISSQKFADIVKGFRNVPESYKKQFPGEYTPENYVDKFLSSPYGGSEDVLGVNWDKNTLQKYDNFENMLDDYYKNVDTQHIPKGRHGGNLLSSRKVSPSTTTQASNVLEDLSEVSSYGTSPNPFEPAPTRSPEERGIINVAEMYRKQGEQGLSGPEKWAKRAKDYGIDPIWFDPEFNKEAGKVLYEEIGLQTGWADSTVTKAKNAFRKDNPNFKGKINEKTVPYEVMQPYIEKFEAGKYGPNFMNPGGDAGLMGFAPDWWKEDGAYKFNADKTLSLPWRKIHQLKDFYKNKNQGLYNLQYRTGTDPLNIFQRSF